MQPSKKIEAMPTADLLADNTITHAHRADCLAQRAHATYSVERPRYALLLAQLSITYATLAQSEHR